MSSRSRIPLSGRSNRNEPPHSSSARPESYMGDQSSRPQTGRNSISSEEKAMWNDPLRIYQPFTPRDAFAPKEKSLPPILPKSPWPTVPVPDKPPRPKRPVTCPQNWLEESQKPDLFNRSSFTTNLDDETKVKHCRDFIERNQNGLWKYDSEYVKKTPRSLCREIVRDRNFVGIMTQNYAKERVLKLSNSDSTKDCLTFDPDPHERFKNSAFQDPYLTSLTTSRHSRDQKIETLLAPATASVEKRFNRGHDHAPEYGNFSRYNQVLKNNQASVLKR